MKKLVLMFVAVAAISFASCVENKPANNVEQEPIDSVTVEADSIVADSVAAPVDSVVAE